MPRLTRLLAGAIASVMIGSALSVGAWYLFGRAATAPHADLAAALQRHEELERAASASAAAQAAARPPAGSPQPACAFEPLLAATGPDDHRYRLAQAMRVATGDDPAPFVRAAQEAASARRQRDAEVALIVACRVAARASGARGLSVGDVQLRLAEHYLAAAHEAPGAGRQPRHDEILGRAETLMAASVRAYGGVLGEESSRTAQARERLAAIRAARVGDPPVPGAQPPIAKVPGPSANIPEARRQPEPEQRSASERVRDDPQLAQLDSDLRRLAAQARAVTDDPAGLERRSARELARRERCTDRNCLLRWYAARRKQLLGEF